MREMDVTYPCISVIVPFYNAMDHFEETLDSIASQRFDSFEVILLDDGSTDESPSIARRRALLDKRFRYVRQNNQGAGAARNHGLSLARGAYLAFLDADDLFDPMFLSTLHRNAIKSGSDVTVCRADCFESSTGMPLGPYGADMNRLSAGPHEPVDYQKRLFQSFLTVPWDKLFKMRFIKERGLTFQNLTYSNDNYFVSCAIEEASSICVVDQTLVHYRIGTGHSLRDRVAKDPLCDLLALDAIVSRGRGVRNSDVEASLLSWCCAAVYGAARNLAVRDESAVRVFCEEYFTHYESRWGVDNLSYADALSKSDLWRYRRFRSSSVKGFTWACRVGSVGRAKQAKKSLLKKAKFAVCLALASMFTRSSALGIARNRDE